MRKGFCDERTRAGHERFAQHPRGEPVHRADRGAVLFVDEGLPLPRWLAFRDLDDLKANLLSVVIAVLAVLFLREAVSWDGTRNLLELGAALSLMIGVLIFFLSRKGGRKD